jgi:hypothetical protein
MSNFLPCIIAELLSNEMQEVYKDEFSEVDDVIYLRTWQMREWTID